MPRHTPTKYPGVTYSMVRRLSGDELERIYYVRYRTGGRGTKETREPVGRESEGMTARKAAQIREDRARGKELSNRQRRERAQELADRPTIAKLWVHYHEARAENSSAASDASRYRLFIEPEFNDMTPDGITTQDVDRLRVRLQKDGKSPQTVKHVLALLRRVIRFAVMRGLVSMPDPSRLHFEMPQVDNTKTECLTPEQVAALLKALDEDHDQVAASAIRLALATGMRRGALLGLTWEDCDFEAGFIILRGATAKKGRTERIPMNEAARSILLAIPRTQSPFIFPGRGGGRRSDLNRPTHRIKKAAGLPDDFRPLHGLRHTFASHLASSGNVDLYTLQKLLTHGSAQMTQRYAHLADEALQRGSSVACALFATNEAGPDEQSACQEKNIEPECSSTTGT
ncbi:MAG TPA: site-specific integrase [Nitratidesulfovibrio sp.]|nr:site-specific integrase [Nitratidesulfovibrio sp.]